MVWHSSKFTLAILASAYEKLLAKNKKHSPNIGEYASVWHLATVSAESFIYIAPKLFAYYH